MSAIGWTEFLCGPVEANDVELAERIVQTPLPFMESDAPVAARLFNLGGRRRGSFRMP